MDQEFWTERWAEGQIGWHAASPNRFLAEYIDRLACAAGDPVLVPLCGKSLDLAWLATQAGYRPVGVEWAEQAVRDSFAENEEQAEIERMSESVDLWHGKSVSILRADWFDVSPEILQLAARGRHIRAWWDRASLIALPPELRRRYVDHLGALLPSGARGLLLSLEYLEGELKGPPFSVESAEVCELFGAEFEIEELATEDALAHDKRRQAQGVTRLDERLYLLQKR